jgi:hypothetical protein
VARVGVAGFTGQVRSGTGATGWRDDEPELGGGHGRDHHDRADREARTETTQGGIGGAGPADESEHVVQSEGQGREQGREHGHGALGPPHIG